MSIKKRIKRALAAFLKDELEEYRPIPFTSLNDRVRIEQYDFETLVMEEIIPIKPTYETIGGDPYTLERHISLCKEKFAKEVMKYIQVDAQNLTDSRSIMDRRVRFILRVQKVKQI